MTLLATLQRWWSIKGAAGLEQLDDETLLTHFQQQVSHVCLE